MTVQTEAPPAPATEAQPPVAPAQPAAPAQQDAPRVPAGQPDGGQYAPAGQQPAPQQPAAPAAPVPAAPAGPDLQAELAAAKADLETARAEAKRWKDQSRTQEARSKANHQQVRGLEGVVRQIAEKLEIEYDDQPDPAEVARRLAETTAEARQLRVERAIYLTAAKSGADANALLDSREFIARTEQIDPEASDFADQVADLVREAGKQAKYQLPAPPAPEPSSLTPQQAQPPAQQQPAAQFQQPPAQPPAPSSGADFSGAPGGNRLWTQADYDYWTAPGRDRDGKVMARAIEDGLLINLGVGKPSRRSRRW
jgi:hypothetical protein